MYLFILCEDDIVMVNELRNDVNVKLKWRRDTLASENYKISRTKIWYMDCNFSVHIQKIKLQWELNIVVKFVSDTVSVWFQNETSPVIRTFDFPIRKFVSENIRKLHILKYIENSILASITNIICIGYGSNTSPQI